MDTGPATVKEAQHAPNIGQNCSVSGCPFYNSLPVLYAGAQVEKMGSLGSHSWGCMHGFQLKSYSWEFYGWDLSEAGESPLMSSSQRSSAQTLP